MATNYDVLFLRLMVQQGLTERAEALRCLQAIDGAAQQGRSLNAAQAALELGLADRGAAEQIHGMVSQQFEQSGEMLRALDNNQAELEVSAEHPTLNASSDTGSVHYFDLSQTGDGLDGYQLGPLLGHGVAGSSFQGRRSDGAPVVVKTLHPRFSDHPEFLQQVLHELTGWLGFRHPNVAATLAIGTSHGHSVVVFEHANGQPLDEFLAQRGPLPVNEALAILIDVCSALEAAHAQGLYVGDLRSHKIVFDGTRARLTDLGMSRASCLAGGFGGYGIPFGHPAALAPEILQESQTRPQAASDVYALGILFYELICGRAPFSGDVQQLLEQHLEAPLPPPPDDVTFSTAVAGVILRMTAKAADQRVQDVAHLREALEQLQQGRPFRLMTGRAQPPVELISERDWDQASQKQMARESRMWSATAIRKAPLVGPSDIGPTTSTVGGIPMGQVSGRLPPELVQQLRAEASSSNIAPARFEAKIGEKLGRGTVGTTYDGRVPSLETNGPVVIKVVSRKYAKHQEIMDMILGELRKAKGFQHENVVPILEVVSAGGRDLVIMPKVNGQTLRQLLDERGRLPMLDAVAIVSDVAAALEAADERGFAHGDLRPEKIFIDPSGAARLADFGHAKAACLGAGLGKHGLYFGDPNYLAPEVLQERQQEPGLRGDLYSLGIVFYEMLCGKRPFEGADPKETLLNHLKQPLPPPPKDVVMPQAVANTIMRLTAKDPTKRYDAVADLEEGLQECRDVAAASGEHAAISAVSAGLSGSHVVDGVAVEEFDPLASSTAGDVKSAWAERSQVTQKAEAGWSKEKIKKAQKVGPRSWDGPAMDAEKADQFSALYDEMKKASGEHATPKKGKSKRNSAKLAKGGETKKKKKGKGKDEKVDTKQLAITGGALLAVVVGIVAMVIFEPFAEKKVVHKTPTTTHGGGGPVVDPDADRKKAEELKLQAAKIDEALVAYAEAVQGKVRAGEFKAAMAVKDDLLPTEWRSIPRVKTAIGEAELKASTASSEKVTKERKAIQRYLDGDQLQRAMSRVRKMKTWVVNEAEFIELKALVVGRQQQATKELKAIATLFGGKFSRGPVEASLRTQLKGWSGGGSLGDAGDLILEYDGPRPLIKDLKRVMGGSAKVTAAPVGGQGILIKATKRPTIIMLDLDLRYVLEAQLRFVLKEDAGADAELALVAGIQNRNKGLGVKWGLIPIRVSQQGNLKASRGADRIKVQGRRVMVMTLRATPDRRKKSKAVLAGSLIEASNLTVKPGGQERIQSDKLAGKVGVVARNVEFWIQGLKVKGLVAKQ